MNRDAHDLAFGLPEEPHGNSPSRSLLLLTVRDVARILRVSTRTVHRLVETGEFVKPLRIGRSTRWRASDVLDWLRSQ
jgi:prophage regulatory protein